MDSAAALKCNGSELESWLVGHLREKQCTLEGQAQYVNVQGSVHWEGVHSVGECTLGVPIFLIDC